MQKRSSRTGGARAPRRKQSRSTGMPCRTARSPVRPGIRMYCGPAQNRAAEALHFYIDRLWVELSKHLEVEACVWCMDDFGVSWQVVPPGQGDLMQHRGAHPRMLEMKKLSIAGLRGD